MLGPYVSSGRPVLVRCSNGHESRPRPAGVLTGHGICRACFGRDPAVSEAKFRRRLAELGAVPLGPYVNSTTPVEVRCAGGHKCWPAPSHVNQGGGFCRVCAGQDPAVAEAKLRARLAELRAELVSPYVNTDTPVLVRCAAGHECWPKPTNIMQGQGVCNKCAHAEWTVFYVVTAESAGRVKFGISSLGGMSRLAVHRSAGYNTVVRLLTGLPGDVAPELERDVQATLALAGLQPVKGREYFDIGALAVILDVVDNYPVGERVPVAVVAA
jgi:hypothetical protein